MLLPWLLNGLSLSKFAGEWTGSPQTFSGRSEDEPSEVVCVLTWDVVRTGALSFCRISKRKGMNFSGVLP